MGFALCPSKFLMLTAEAIAALLLAGRARLSISENTIFLIGAAKIAKTIKDKVTTATGRFMTKRAV